MGRQVAALSGFPGAPGQLPGHSAGEYCRHLSGFCPSGAISGISVSGVAGDRHPGSVLPPVKEIDR